MLKFITGQNALTCMLAWTLGWVVVVVISLILSTFLER